MDITKNTNERFNAAFEMQDNTTYKSGICYALIRETYICGSFERTSYGAAAIEYPSGAVIASVHDLLTDSRKASEFVSLLNRLGMSPEQLEEAAADILGSTEW